MTRDHSPTDIQLTIATACDHLAARDARLKRLIDIFGPPNLNPDRDPYQALVRSIIFQQISGKAAQAILQRFLALFPGDSFPSAARLAQAEAAGLRAAGLSQRKAEYVIAIAQAFLETDFQQEGFREMSDQEVSERLTRIRGVGQWTADMFMIFTLARLDVLPLSDQGIRNGMRRFFELENHLIEAEMLRLTEHWKPYRSVASWYMWKVVDEEFTW